MGGVDSKTRGGVDNIIKTENGYAAAKIHLEHIRNAVLKAAEQGLIPKDESLLGAYTDKWYRSILNKSNPVLAEMNALNRGDLNILAGFAPPTGNRFGYQILKYTNEANPAEFHEPFTLPSALAALDAWDKILDAKREAMGVGALTRKPGEIPSLPARNTGKKPNPADFEK